MYSCIHDKTDVDMPTYMYIILIHDADTQCTHTYMCIYTPTQDTLLPPSLPPPSLLFSFPPFLLSFRVSSRVYMEHVPESVNNASSSLIHQYTVYIVQRGYYGSQRIADQCSWRTMHTQHKGPCCLLLNWNWKWKPISLRIGKLPYIQGTTLPIVGNMGSVC